MRTGRSGRFCAPQGSLPGRTPWQPAAPAQRRPGRIGACTRSRCPCRRNSELRTPDMFSYLTSFCSRYRLRARMARSDNADRRCARRHLDASEPASPCGHWTTTAVEPATSVQERKQDWYTPPDFANDPAFSIPLSTNAQPFASSRPFKAVNASSALSRSRKPTTSPPSETRISSNPSTLNSSSAKPSGATPSTAGSRAVMTSRTASSAPSAGEPPSEEPDGPPTASPGDSVSPPDAPSCPPPKRSPPPSASCVEDGGSPPCTAFANSLATGPGAQRDRALPAASRRITPATVIAAQTARAQCERFSPV